MPINASPECNHGHYANPPSELQVLATDNSPPGFEVTNPTHLNSILSRTDLYMHEEPVGPSSNISHQMGHISESTQSQRASSGDASAGGPTLGIKNVIPHKSRGKRRREPSL